MKQLQNNLNIGIAGLGLIGGSLYKNLKQNKFENLYACTSNKETENAIKNDGFIASADENILKNCDIIFVCTPISKTVSTIEKIFSINTQSIIVDVASLKGTILKEIENKLPYCKFIGSHPMAGTENSGYESSFATLFDNAVWVLTPSKNVNEDEINTVKNIINLTGAKAMEANAEEHDKAVALISHMPMLLSQSLMKCVLNNDLAKTLASSGFRDMTRLAASNKTMANDMLSLNKENIKSALENIISISQELLNADYFSENIDEIIATRRKLYDENGKNSFRNNC